ncbi:MAG TPA: lytic transglycosylase domain-containing protein [Flavitalea sp.]|nr:lytic transglycosylase domain-containing protein [Flavitalea sp.]
MKKKFVSACFMVLVSLVGLAASGNDSENQVAPLAGITSNLSASIHSHDSLLSPARSFSKDSLDPTRGFNNLFAANSTSIAATTSGTFSGARTVRLNPRAMTFVQDYMERESENLIALKEWGRPYFNMMDAILIRNGLPKELKYLAVIESRLKSSALSCVGAVGPWQFMAETARDFGLKVNGKVDERRDYVKSTNAAAKYLKSLYGEFGDWLLVIAAYNGGSGTVYNAIKKSGSRNFWDLQYFLPAESRTHVKKFIGTHYIFEGQGGVTTLTKKEVAEQVGSGKGKILLRNLTHQEIADAKTVRISGKYHSQVIAQYLNMDIMEFNRYNPDFDRVISLAENAYELKLPAAKMETFASKKFQILEDSINMLMLASNTTARS